MTLRRNRPPRGWAERGQAFVEFGLVSTVFFLLLFGIFDMARLFESWMAVQHAAREGARYAITGRVDCTGYTNNRDECIVFTAKDATAGLTDGGASGNAVVSTEYWHYPNYDTVASGAGGPCDQLQVTVEYVHHFVTPIVQVFAPNGVHIKGSQRMTSEPYNLC
jgi:Flp pilus assembly protein TadG